MNEFRFICARLILDERVLKILSVTERHTNTGINIFGDGIEWFTRRVSRTKIALAIVVQFSGIVYPQLLGKQIL